jgi:hypothetical protein
MGFTATKKDILESALSFLLSCFEFFFKPIKSYFWECKKHHLKIFLLFPFLFALSRFVPRFADTINENISPKTVISLWILLVNFCLCARLSAILPISVDVYEKIKNGFLKIRDFIFPGSLFLSCWLTFQGFTSLFSEQFLYKKFFAALLLQALFILLFCELPKREDVEDFRYFRKYEMPKQRRILYQISVIFIFLSFPLLLIYLIGDIYTLPDFKISK